MEGWVYYVNFAIAVGGLMAVLLGLMIVLGLAYVQRWDRRYLCATFSVLALYVGSDLVAQVSMNFLGPDFLWLSGASVFFEMLFSITLVPLVTAYMFACAGEDGFDSALLRVAVSLCAVYIALLVTNLFSGAFYTLSEDGRRVEAASWFPLLSLVTVLLFAVSLFALYQKRGMLTQRQRRAFSTYLTLPLTCVFLQAMLFDVRVIVLGTCVASLAMLSFLLADLVDAHVRQREEAALQHAQVMALQMRPHFIYNVMSSIYYLCEQDPARAQQVTSDFTDYLRANFDAIGQGGEVAFSKELEHTRAYLAVEQARLEDALDVEIDCPHTGFRLPSLTLQPLVENAVKHGADPELPQLHVRVATREGPGCAVIVVEDTGPGFDEDLPAGYPASALANIRERLAARGASLDISPREAGGTVATIRIPN